MVKQGQSLLTNILGSMRTDKFHRSLIQWSGKYFKEVCSYNIPGIEIHKRATAVVAQADRSGKT